MKHLAHTLFLLFALGGCAGQPEPPQAAVASTEVRRATVDTRVTPRAELVQFGDEPFALDSDDFIEITLAHAPAALSLEDIELHVEGDSFGGSAAEDPLDYVRFDWPYAGNARVARIYLGSGVRLTAGGHAAFDNTKPGEASGVWVSGAGLLDIADQRVGGIKLAFDRYYDTYRARVLQRARMGDSCLQNYALSYDLDGLLAMYEATRFRRYLEEAMYFVDILIEKTADQDSDGYLDFRGTTHTLNKNRPTFNVALCDWKAGRPVARLARLIDEDPDLVERYAARQESYRTFVDRHLVEKWSAALNVHEQDMYMPESVYFVESDDLIHRIAHYGDIVSDAWIATQDEEQGRVLDGVLSRVCADLVSSDRHPGAVEWDVYMEGPRATPAITRRYGQPYDGIGDTSHANGTVAFLISAVLRGGKRCEGREILDDLAFTFRNVITQRVGGGGEPNYRFADFVDGGVLTDGQPPYSVGRFIEDGWLKLGEIDPEVQAIAQNFYDENGPLHRLQFLGNLARNYALARWQ